MLPNAPVRLIQMKTTLLTLLLGLILSLQVEAAPVLKGKIDYNLNLNTGVIGITFLTESFGWYVHKIIKVHPGSPAALIGLMPGDEIKEIGENDRLDDIRDIGYLIVGRPNTSIYMVIERDKQKFYLRVNRVDFKTLKSDAYEKIYGDLQ